MYNQLNEHIKTKIENEKLGVKLGTAGNEAANEDITSISDGLGLAMLNQIEQYENPYQAALRKTIKYLDYYDTDGFMPFFGYGAKLPPFRNSVSHCFAVNGNIFQPEERGIVSLM